MLGRDTPWRQGDLLTADSARALDLVGPDDTTNHGVIIISHDCDLPHDAEPFVEVIVVDVIEKSDPALSHAKNPRRLHMTFENGDCPAIIIELRHTNRKEVLKTKFKEEAVKDDSTLLGDGEKRTLKQWLAARYGRPAFPNAFEARLRKLVHSKRTVEWQIAKILEPVAMHLVALFFDLGEQRYAELAEGIPYAISITLVYDSIEGGPSARQAAEDTARQLRSIFENAYGEVGNTTEIAIESCEAVADTMITLADLRRVDQWRLEYLSLGDQDAGDFLPVGEIPA